MEKKKKQDLKGRFGNVYMIDYSDVGIHAYFTMGIGNHGPYNDDDYDCEVINDTPYQYNSGGGGDIKSCVEAYAKHVQNGSSVWFDFDLLSKNGLEFPEETKSLFLKEPMLLVFSDPESGFDPNAIDDETYAGFCYCSICGPMVDENDMMCDHVVYTPNGTDEYAGIGNDDIKCAAYVLRYIGKDCALSCVDYQYGHEWWVKMEVMSGDYIEDDEEVSEWCEHLKDEYGFCPASIEDAMMVWRGAQLLGSIDNEAREKMPDAMDKLRAMILAYPYETSTTKRPISESDLPMDLDGRTLNKSRAYDESFMGVFDDSSKVDLTTIFIDAISMEIATDEEE